MTIIDTTVRMSSFDQAGWDILDLLADGLDRPTWLKGNPLLIKLINQGSKG
jgi:hypothetical protein